MISKLFYNIISFICTRFQNFDVCPTSWIEKHEEDYKKFKKEKEEEKKEQLEEKKRLREEKKKKLNNTRRYLY